MNRPFGCLSAHSRAGGNPIGVIDPIRAAQHHSQASVGGGYDRLTEGSPAILGAACAAARAELGGAAEAHALQPAVGNLKASTLRCGFWHRLACVAFDFESWCFGRRCCSVLTVRQASTPLELVSSIACDAAPFTCLPCSWRRLRMRLLPPAIRLAKHFSQSSRTKCCRAICSSDFPFPAVRPFGATRSFWPPAPLVQGRGSLSLVSSLSPAALVTRADLPAAVLLLRLWLPVSSPGCSSTVLAARSSVSNVARNDVMQTKSYACSLGRIGAQEPYLRRTAGGNCMRSWRVVLAGMLAMDAEPAEL
jgi:hypothetical protein